MSHLTGSEPVGLLELPVSLLVLGTGFDLALMCVVLSELGKGHWEWVFPFLIPTASGALSGIYLLTTRKPSCNEGLLLRPLATFVFLFMNLGLVAWVLGLG